MAGLVTFCLLQVPGWAAGAAGIAAAPLPAAAVAAIPAALEPAARGELLATGSTSAFFGKQAETGLCPNPAAAADLMRILGALHPNIGIQALVAAAMPGSLAARADRDLRLYNLMHQFHTMEGIPYFSATHGEMRTFFTASNVVNGPEQRTAQKDPEYPAIQPSHGFFVEQDDTTFGKNLYAVTVKGLAGGAVELTMTNVEPVRYGVLQVLAPGALTLALVGQPSVDGQYLYLYGNVGLRTGKVLGMEGKVRVSFHNRIVALCNWFLTQAAR